jgi:hypothetical protein
MISTTNNIPNTGLKMKNLIMPPASEVSGM